MGHLAIDLSLASNLVMSVFCTQHSAVAALSVQDQFRAKSSFLQVIDAALDVITARENMFFLQTEKSYYFTRGNRFGDLLRFTLLHQDSQRNA